MTCSTVSLGTFARQRTIAGCSDCNADLLWQNTATGEKSIWLMNGTTIITGASLGVFPTQWSVGN